MQPSSGRYFEYDYAFERTSHRIDPIDLQIAVGRFSQFLDDQTNCSYHSINSCGEPLEVGLQRSRNSDLVAEYEGRWRSDWADNIVSVNNTGMHESETLYENSVYSLKFDRVTRQRWGSTYATASQQSLYFNSTLPEAFFDYFEPVPDASGTSDATAVLDAEFINRYPLEDRCF